MVYYQYYVDSRQSAAILLERPSNDRLFFDLTLTFDYKLVKQTGFKISLIKCLYSIGLTCLANPLQARAELTKKLIEKTSSLYADKNTSSSSDEARLRSIISVANSIIDLPVIPKPDSIIQQLPSDLLKIIVEYYGSPSCSTVEEYDTHLLRSSTQWFSCSHDTSVTVKTQPLSKNLSYFSLYCLFFPQTDRQVAIFLNFLSTNFTSPPQGINWDTHTVPGVIFEWVVKEYKYNVRRDSKKQALFREMAVQIQSFGPLSVSRTVSLQELRMVHSCSCML